MKRMGWAGLAGVALLWGMAAVAADRNVVVVVADDMGLELGCYGHPVVKTPHMDALAREGTRFTHAFCTTASCSASRSVILTGLQNHANGQYGHQHGEGNFHTFTSVKGLPVLLRDAGYRTASIGKFHVQPEAVYHFDEYLTGRELAGGRNGVAMAERCREFISAESEKPFLLYFCSIDPHRAARGFGNEASYPGNEKVTYPPEEVVVPPFLPDQPEVRAELAQYSEAVSRFDQGVGRLMEVLKETGHLDDTLVILLSDNGIPFPGAKTSLYEPGMRLPLIVRSPDQKTRGGTTDAMVTWADLVPTILDYTEAKGPGYPLHGKSFLGVLDREQSEGFDEIHASHTFHEVQMYYPMRVVRERRYKLIWNVAHPLPIPFASDLWASDTWQGVLKRGDTTYGKRTMEAFLKHPAYELYDLEEDPDEAHNLVDSPEHAEVLARLQRKLKTFQQATKDPWYVKHEHE